MLPDDLLFGVLELLFSIKNILHMSIRHFENRIHTAHDKKIRVSAKFVRMKEKSARNHAV